MASTSSLKRRSSSRCKIHSFVSFGRNSDLDQVEGNVYSGWGLFRVLGVMS